MEVKARTKFARGSCFKYRRYCHLIRGKKAQDALNILDHMPSPLAQTIFKTLQAAVANADHNHSVAIADLKVKCAIADGGPMLKRFQPRARGRAFPIMKRMSHLTIVLESKEQGA
jgi:large subunit ribosomal protein L22